LFGIGYGEPAVREEFGIPDDRVVVSVIAYSPRCCSPRRSSSPALAEVYPTTTAWLRIHQVAVPAGCCSSAWIDEISWYWAARGTPVATRVAVS